MRLLQPVNVGGSRFQGVNRNMVAKVFIDGAVGTTGLEIHERLANRRDVELVRLGESKRKDSRARGEALNRADLVILCLPDEAAKEREYRAFVADLRKVAELVSND